MYAPVLMKLKRSTALSQRDELALRQVLGRYKVIPARQNVVWDGDRPAYATVLLDGLMCRYTAMPDGRRQILSFLLPGDFCDLSALIEDQMDHAVASLATCMVAAVEHNALEHVIDTHPSIRHALWRETLRDAAIYRAWLASVGRRSAYERLAHLFCEIALRLDSVGLKRTDGYVFEATQNDIGDALGLSVVHVNRTLQQLRDDELFTFRGSTFAIHDWPRLQEIAGFSPEYLQLGRHSNLAGVAPAATSFEAE